MLLEKGKIYKKVHKGMLFQLGWKNNFIIFSPHKTIVCNGYGMKIKCDFLVTFDCKLLFDCCTDVMSNCRFVEITKEDIEQLASLFSDKGLLNQFITYLPNKFKYNRKLGKAIEI